MRTKRIPHGTTGGRRSLQRTDRLVAVGERGGQSSGRGPSYLLDFRLFFSYL